MPTKVLHTENDREDVIEAIRKLDITKRKHYVKWAKKTKTRNLSQNALFHFWVAIIADDAGTTPAECKEDVKREWGIKQYRINTFDKEVIEIKSTRDYTEQEMSELLSRMKQYGDELGLLMPNQQDRDFQAMYDAYKDKL